MDTPLVQTGLAEAYEGDIAAARAERDARSRRPEDGRRVGCRHASLYLASDEAKYVNGHLLVVDGGLSRAIP